MAMRSKFVESYDGIKIWRCPRCSFGMDAVHVKSSEHGLDQWECPECGTTDDGDGTVVVRPDEQKKEWDQQCKSCGGTGLYVGMAERSGAAVVCNKCHGSGSQHVIEEYLRFQGRRHRQGVTRVYQTSAGIILDPTMMDGGVSYDKWKMDGASARRPGTEIRQYTCPAWWYQSADSSKKPDWVECNKVWGRFDQCPSFTEKSKCWERWDVEYKERDGEEKVREMRK